MLEKERFRVGQKVESYTLTGQKIIGKYVRARNSFGVIIHGTPEGELGESQDYVCSRLTLKSLEPKRPGRKPNDIHYTIQPGDAVTARLNGQIIHGVYAGAAPKPYAFLRILHPFKAPETIKVLRETIRKA